MKTGKEEKGRNREGEGERVAIRIKCDKESVFNLLSFKRQTVAKRNSIFHSLVFSEKPPQSTQMNRN